MIAWYLSPQAFAAGTPNKDMSGNNRDLVGAVTVTESNAALFNGQLLSAPSLANFDFGGEFTVSVWFKRASNDGNYQGIVSTGYYTNGNFEIRMGRENGGTMVGGGVGVSGKPTMWDFVYLRAEVGQWNHVVMSYSSSRKVLNYYINGVQQKTDGPAGVLDKAMTGAMLRSSNPFYIGGAQPGQEVFRGAIKDVRLYKTFASVNDVSLLYTGKGVTPPKSQVCNTKECPINCAVSGWSAWSVCSVTCGGGMQTQTRTITTQPAFGGVACPALSQSQPCNTQGCPVNCAVSSWSAWSACSATCNGGSQTQTRTVVVQPKNGGAACPSLSQTQSCNTQPCPRNCVVSSWSPWGACSAPCGRGSQMSTRSVITAAAYGGTACPSLTQQQACNTHACPVNCVVSGWSAWSGCSATCGGGSQTQTRSIVVVAANGGAACPALSQSQNCNMHNCPVHCTVSSWTAWSACTRTCGGGVQTQTRHVVQAAMYGGNACPVLSQQQSCNTQPCPVNCEVGAWSAWSTCDRSCGGGSQTQTRVVLTQAAHGGSACPALRQTQPCNTHNCPVHCDVSGWSSWSACSAACGGGSQRQTRTITVQPAYGGNACPTLVNTQNCNMQSCPVNCAVTSWSAWSACSKTCGSGLQVSTRSVVVYAAFGGTACPSLTQSQTCNTQPCAINCAVSGWSAWSACSAVCGGGVQTHTRTITQASAYGGT